MRRVVVVGSPLMKVVGDIVPSRIGSGVLEVDDNVLGLELQFMAHLVVFRHTPLDRRVELEQVSILGVVVWSESERMCTYGKKRLLCLCLGRPQQRNGMIGFVAGFCLDRIVGPIWPTVR